MTILDSLEAAEAKATAGPWEWRANVSKGECVQAGSAGLIFTPRRDDAALIALLRNHAADLIAVARAAQGVHYWLWERDAHWTDDAEAITATEDAAQVLDAALRALKEGKQ